MIDDKDLYLLVNLIDLHSRTSDQELGMKLKLLSNKILDKLLEVEEKEWA